MKCLTLIGICLVLVGCEYWFPPPAEPGFGDEKLVEYLTSIPLEEIEAVRIFSSNKAGEENSLEIKAEAFPSLLSVLGTLQGLEVKPAGQSNIGQAMTILLRSGDAIDIRLVTFSSDQSRQVVSVLHHRSYHAMFRSPAFIDWMSQHLEAVPGP